MCLTSYECEILKSLLSFEEQRINTIDSTAQAIKTWSITITIAIAGIIIEGSNPRLASVIIALAFLFSAIDFAYRKVQLFHVKKSILIKHKLAQSMADSRTQSLKKLYIMEAPKFLSPKLFSPDYDYFSELLYWPIVYIGEVLLALTLIWLIPNNLSVSFIRNLTIIGLGVVIYLFIAAMDCFRILQTITSTRTK